MIILVLAIFQGKCLHKLSISRALGQLFCKTHKSIEFSQIFKSTDYDKYRFFWMELYVSCLLNFFSVVFTWVQKHWDLCLHFFSNYGYVKCKWYFHQINTFKGHKFELLFSRSLMTQVGDNLNFHTCVISG